VATAQKYQAEKQVSRGGDLVSFSSVTNSVKASDVAPSSSSQNYTDFSSEGDFYNCQIASQSNTLTRVSRGCAPGRH
ncbi:MAG: hypothetical protein ACXWJB_15260, partial [Limisphaerales bacterium]